MLFWQSFTEFYDTQSNALIASKYRSKNNKQHPQPLITRECTKIIWPIKSHLLLHIVYARLCTDTLLQNFKRLRVLFWLLKQWYCSWTSMFALQFALCSEISLFYSENILAELYWKHRESIIVRCVKWRNLFFNRAGPGQPGPSG